ncbi:hypothetical protein LguiA_017981 [Lonicera macranthoides]
MMFEDSASIPSIWTSMNSWFTPTVLFVLLNVMIGTILFSSSLAHPQEQKEEETHQDQNQNQNQNQNQPKLGRSPSVLQRLRSINFYNYRSQEQQPTALFKQQEQENLEAETHYLFEQTHQEKTLESQTHYLFEQTHQQQTSDSDTHYPFEQTHQAKTLESNTLYFFKQQENQETESQNKVTEDQNQETETQFDEEEDGEPQSLDEVYSQLTDHHHFNSTKNDTMQASGKSDTMPASGEVPAKLPAKMRKSASVKSSFGHFEESDIVEARRPATVKERRAKVTDGDQEVDAKADDFINKFKHQLKLQRLDSIIRYKEVINRSSVGK